MSRIPSEKKQILMVDDAATTLEVYTRFLRPVEAICVTYNSSAGALLWSEVNDPDLVIVDFDMPAPNGHEFIERFRCLPGKLQIPIVMVTAAQEKGVRYRALELGASDFLSKPVDPIEFVARSRNLLALRDSQKKLTDRAGWLAAEVKRATAALADREQETLFRLLRLAELRDNETANHIVRIGHFAGLLGETFGLPASDVELLQLAAPMHDIGKVATPDSILLKPAALTAVEWQVMREHTTVGYNLLKDSKSTLLQKGAEIALTHHEKFDGSGYPGGVRGDAIPLFGRITALVDVFDALTSERPYKKGWSIAQATDRIQQDSGSHFDPALVSAFLGVLPQAAEIKLQYSDFRAA